MKARIKETGETIEGFLDGHGHFEVPVDHCIFDRYDVEDLELEENGNPILRAASDLVEAVEGYVCPKKEDKYIFRNEVLAKCNALKKLLNETE